MYNTTLVNNEHTRKRYDEFHKVQTYKRYRNQFVIPTQFDPRNSWKTYLSPIKNQNDCGSCYAFAISSALSDRIALLTSNQLKVTLTATNIVVCPLPEKGQDLFLSLFVQSKIDKTKRLAYERAAQQQHGCQGNNLLDPCMFVYYVGCTLTSCEPETLLNRFELPTCEEIEDTLNDLQFNGCYNTNKAQRDFRILYLYCIDKDHPDNISYEIYKYGPVVSGYIIFDDFYDYAEQLKTNPTYIYTHPKRNTSSLGGHAIVICGWGKTMQDGREIEYWLIRNSWGDKFGDKGYFRMEKWLPECMLEDNVVSFIPDLPNTQDLDLPIPNNPVFNNYTEFQLRQKYIVDPLTFYSDSTIKAINDKLLYGSSQPIYIPEYLPTIDDKFNVGSIRNYRGMYILLIVVILLLIGLNVYKFKHK